MCMDAHVPSQWDICGNSELAVMAKLAKLCQGRDPSEGCNMYHCDLAQALCHRNPEFKQGSSACFPSVIRSVICAQVCIYCASCPQAANVYWWNSDRVKLSSPNTCTCNLKGSSRKNPVLHFQDIEEHKQQEKLILKVLKQKVMEEE